MASLSQAKLAVKIIQNSDESHTMLLILSPSSEGVINSFSSSTTLVHPVQQLIHPSATLHSGLYSTNAFPFHSKSCNVSTVEPCRFSGSRKISTTRPLSSFPVTLLNTIIPEQRSRLTSMMPIVSAPFVMTPGLILQEDIFQVICSACKSYQSDYDSKIAC